MQIKHRGLLVYSKVYKENDLFIKFLSHRDELFSGIVYGGTAKKNKNVYQVGYFLDFEIFYKPNQPLSLKGEISKPYVSNIVNDKYKLNCLLCITSLVNLSILEGQKINNIFIIVDNFLIKMFNEKRWFIDFCIFLFQLLKIIGYEVDILNSNRYKYFDLEELKFHNNIKVNSIEFPYKFFEKKTKIEKKTVNQILNIFETVFIKNHLSNLNLQLPNQYHLFKKLIIETIKE